MTASEQDRQQIAALIEHYRHGFDTLDGEELKAIWDQDYENIIYIAQERALSIHGWTGVEDYYKQNVTDYAGQARMEVHDLSVDVFGDMAYAFVTFHFEASDKDQVFKVDGRNTFLLRRKSGMWKVIHYHESSQGSM